MHGYSTVGATEPTISPRAAELYEDAALDLTDRFADSARRRAPGRLRAQVERAGADDCVRRFVQNTGACFYRRPLTTQEQDEYLTTQRPRELGDLGRAWCFL